MAMIMLSVAHCSQPTAYVILPCPDDNIDNGLLSPKKQTNKKAKYWMDLYIYIYI